VLLLLRQLHPVLSPARVVMPPLAPADPTTYSSLSPGLAQMQKHKISAGARQRRVFIQNTGTSDLSSARQRLQICLCLVGLSLIWYVFSQLSPLFQTLTTREWRQFRIALLLPRTLQIWENLQVSMLHSPDAQIDETPFPK